MKSPMEFKGRWLLVTGASSGLGQEMAIQLARQHGANLILVARRAERLQELKAKLEQEAGIRCHVITADLAQPEDVERVYAEAKAVGPVYGVILNAGVTHFGEHLALDWAAFQTMLATNVTSVVRLVHLFMPDLIRRREGGGVMIISSMAGLLPVPYQSAYAGTKAFVTNFAQSLYQELREQNVSITVFSPGGIDTAMTHNSNLKFFENTPFLQDVESCASDALKAMRARDPLYVPGRLNQAQLFFTRFVPRKVVGFIAQNAYRKALGST